VCRKIGLRVLAEAIIKKGWVAKSLFAHKSASARVTVSDDNYALHFQLFGLIFLGCWHEIYVMLNGSEWFCEEF
jgi:hypothetical protein